MSRHDGYLGNPLVKDDGIVHNYTPEEVSEYKKCMESPAYFARNYIKVINLDRGLVPFDLYPYQEKMFEHFHENRFSIVLACRQSGKSISSVIFLLHYAIFNPEMTIVVLANKGSTAREMLSRITCALENLPFFLQPGCRVLNKGSIEFSNRSKIIAAATSSSSVRGISANVIFLDEFSFVNRATEFYTSTYPVISSGKSTKVIITSTANGVGNQFYRIWSGAVQGVNEFKPFRVDWWDVPGRDEEWKKKTISNTSELQFEQEFGNSFTGTSNSLLSSTKLLELKSSVPTLIKGSLRLYTPPVQGHKYVMTVDVSKGRGQDYSTFNIIDCTVRPFEQVATFRDNRISPLLFPEVIVSAAKHYNQALVIIENNDAGVVVCNAVYYEYEYENTFVESAIKSGGVGVTMTKRVKRIGCSNLKDLVEMDKLIIRDAETISEISTFESNGSSYQASDNNHDDLVMNLVLFAWFVSTDAFGEDIDTFSLKDLLLEGMDERSMNELTPFGFIEDGRNQPKSSSIYEQMAEELNRWNNL
jgi:hypothetical protein